MGCESDVIRVIPGRDNPSCFRISVTECPVGRTGPANLSDVTNITLRIGPKDSPVLDIDSYFRPDAISWNTLTGTITLNLGQDAVPPGLHKAFLTYFSPEYPNGIAVDPFSVFVEQSIS